MNDDLAIAMGERLERIAVALEAIQAHLKPSELAAFHGEEARTTQEPVRWAPSSGPVDPDPPFPVPTVAPSAGIPRLQVGQIHVQGHKPIKENNRGFYCPTKLSDGSWCRWSQPA